MQKSMFLVTTPGNVFVTKNVDTAYTAVAMAINNWETDRHHRPELTKSDWGNENRIWKRWTAIDDSTGNSTMWMEIKQVPVK